MQWIHNYKRNDHGAFDDIYITDKSFTKECNKITLEILDDTCKVGIKLNQEPHYYLDYYMGINYRYIGIEDRPDRFTYFVTTTPRKQDHIRIIPGSKLLLTMEFNFETSTLNYYLNGNLCPHLLHYHSHSFTALDRERMRMIVKWWDTMIFQILTLVKKLFLQFMFLKINHLKFQHNSPKFNC